MALFGLSEFPSSVLELPSMNMDVDPLGAEGFTDLL
jgi:hypothetical protein